MFAVFHHQISGDYLHFTEPGNTLPKLALFFFCLEEGIGHNEAQARVCVQ
jgi:hypothetical protein